MSNSSIRGRPHHTPPVSSFNSRGQEDSALVESRTQTSEWLLLCPRYVRNSAPLCKQARFAPGLRARARFVPQGAPTICGFTFLLCRSIWADREGVAPFLVVDQSRAILGSLVNPLASACICPGGALIFVILHQPNHESQLARDSK